MNEKTTHIELDNVTKSFSDLEVIPPLNLTIQQGEFVVLVGPSGCGKTTTLRMVAGLESVTAGSIRISGEEVTNARPGKRDCAMVFQNYALYPHMSVRDNIGYAMRVHKVDHAVIEERVADAADILGLKPYLDRKPKQLSGGQRQRVAIGRALVRQPQVFLFDEPLSNLDAKLRVEMRSEIKLLQRRLQTTAIYVTHDQIEAMTMADRVVVMRNGRIEQACDPMTLYERPVNRFVANFIGSPAMNFLPVSVKDNVVEIAGQKLPMSEGGQQRLPKHQTITLGIRPEHMRVSKENAILKIHVENIEPLGAHSLILGRVDNHKIVAQIDSRMNVSINDVCEVPIDMGQAHFFDAKTEERL